MNTAGTGQLITSIGKKEADRSGPPVGVVRLDPAKAYANVGELLQAYINDGDEQAWQRIAAGIDYTYESLDLALSPLDAETGFGDAVRARLERGQKLLFKPNLVSVVNIDPATHGPSGGSTACTEWAFIAALMRWFREKLGVGYYQMCLGEAATTMSAVASLLSMALPGDLCISPEATIEGRVGDFIGGWGFYYVRKYLAERLAPGADDDPMAGHEESAAGIYLPPGLVKDKLMVYDPEQRRRGPAAGPRGAGSRRGELRFDPSAQGHYRR